MNKFVLIALVGFSLGVLMQNVVSEEPLKRANQDASDLSDEGFEHYLKNDDDGLEDEEEEENEEDYSDEGEEDDGVEEAQKDPRSRVRWNPYIRFPLPRIRIPSPRIRVPFPRVRFPRIRIPLPRIRFPLPRIRIGKKK